jgi:hypothetical protein
VPYGNFLILFVFVLLQPARIRQVSVPAGHITRGRKKADTEVNQDAGLRKSDGRKYGQALETMEDCWGPVRIY